MYAPAGVVDNYADTVRDWDSGAGNAHGHFGACLSSVTLASPTWTAGGACPMTDGATWRGVSATADAIAVANPLSASSTANVRFGVRIADSYVSGDYVAPIQFSVVAP
jgi:hypothetical protein